ncbi:unnamed protein product [Urochloa decumbens]|uniref:Protein kinase domain-containing protein n=1 Tax=Urochloa decumbens TaxID=240449 RepID=A0ABC9C6K4_9POAL
MAMGKNVPKTLLLRLSVAYYLLCATTLSHATSVSFSYNFSTPGALTRADLKYISNATAAGDRIDLTKDTIWSTGRVAYGQPVPLWDNTGKVASFTSNFTFAIKPHNSTAQGGGMTFFVGAYPPILPQDSNGGFLGLVNNPGNPANTNFPAAVAVEFDAFKNDWDPNGTVNHVGVDVNSVTSAAYAPLPDGCFNGTMSAWVRYDANASTLSATLRFDDLPGLLGLYNVSANVDLKAAGLPQQAAVGFSAATGAFVERHQILSWSFESTLASAAVINKTEIKTSKKTNIGLIAGLVQHHSRHGLCPAVPAPGVGAVRGAQGPQASNVMLDASFTAKLGDFGLARLVDHARAARTTLVAGTRGYIDPECAVTCRATSRSDVYSFGVVLLEIACGRKPVAPDEDESRVLLVRWGEAELERTMVVGLWCVHPDSAARPSIRQAMGVLQFEAPLPELPLEMPVANYGPPAGGSSYRSSNATTSSSGGSGSSRGHSLATSDQTARSSASSVMSGGARGTRFDGTSNTRSETVRSARESNSGRSGTSLSQQFRSTRCSP